MKRLVVLLAVLVALAAPIVAAANVPDPTWIAGLYDGGDGDEALALAWDSAGLTPAAITLAGLHRLLVIAADLEPSPPPRPSVAPTCRAPPLA
jgi:hypothetical protein